MDWHARDAFPPWACPACTTGSLRLQPKLELHETLASRKNGPHADPTEYTGRFHGWLKCDRPGCGEVAVVIGDAATEPEWDDEGQQSYETLFRPTAISPAPLMFLPPKRCPEEVQKELVRAFALYWLDPTAAGNTMRSCVDQILTRRGVPRATVTKGRRRWLTLHRRIERFQLLKPSAGNALMAVKWIGNEGSHGTLAAADVLDAVEVIENVIDDFWGDRRRTLSRLIAQVNRARRPRSRAKPRTRRKPSPGPVTTRT